MKNKGSWIFVVPLLILMPLGVSFYRQLHVVVTMGAFPDYDSADRAALQQLSFSLRSKRARTVVVRYTIIHEPQNRNSLGYVEYKRETRFLNQCDTSYSSGCIPVGETSEKEIHDFAARGSTLNDMRGR